MTESLKSTPGGGARHTLPGNKRQNSERRKQMKMWIKVLVVTLVVAVPAMLLGPVIFPPADVGAEPTAGQMPYFLFLALTDAVLLGLGVSFLLFGFPVMRRVSPDSRLRAWAMYLAIGYLMISWWPHLNRRLLLCP
jgi:hypothetical protein